MDNGQRTLRKLKTYPPEQIDGWTWRNLTFRDGEYIVEIDGVILKSTSYRARDLYPLVRQYVAEHEVR